MKKHTAIDLFAGAGGATQGIRDAGFEVVAAVENDRSAAATFRANHTTTRLYDGDIRDVDPYVLMDELGLKPGDLTLLKACPPCQGFSTLGKGDTSDPRNDLVAEVWRFAKALQPRIVLLENVPGLSGDQRLERLTKKLRAVGFSVRKFLVDATEFGVPQQRKRLIVFCSRTGPARSHSPLLSLGSMSAPSTKNSVRSVFETSAKIPLTDPLQVSRELSDVVAARIAAIPVGGNRFDLPEHLQLDCHKRLKTRSASGPYGRMRLGEPAPTLTTRCTTPSCGAFVHPTETRGITLREAALLQTFPTNYKFCGTYGEIERQIGNAVPVRMAEKLAKAAARLVTDSEMGPT